MKAFHRKLLILLTLVAAAALLSACTAAASDFNDVEEDAWFYDSVLKVADEEIMSGVAQNVFDPNAATTRAMLATVLWRVDGAEKEFDGTPAKFSDLEGDWYRTAVQYMSAKGRIQGYPDGTFRPDREVTRAEAAVMIGNSISSREVSELQKVTPFTDEKKIPDWAKKGIEECQMAGVIGGYADGTFRPDQTITRAEMAKMLAAFIELPMKEEEQEVTGYDPDKATDELIDAVIGDSKENYLISPLSLKGAFGMAANGASGETQQQILDALHLGELDDFNSYYRSLRKKYNAAEEAITVDLNNSLWVNESRMIGFEFKEDFEKQADKFYGAEPGVVNDGNAVETINKWISEKTREKIQNCISSSDFTTALVNTLYFKGAWVTDFGTEATKKGTFTNIDGKKVKTDLMHMTENVQYYEDGSTQVINLPYDKACYEEDGKLKTYFSDMDVSMYVVLSENPVDIAAFLKDIQPRMANRKIVITLPKFSFRSSFDLKAPLQAMGIQKAFTDEAEFTELSELEQKLSSVLQDTYIAVDEEGTEAAAVTVITMEATSAAPEEPYAEFKADRPFQFAIRDNKSGEILFAGAYNKVE